MRSVSFRSGVLLAALLSGAQAPAAEPLWLSDAAPHSRGHPIRGHGGPVEIRKGAYFKRLWLREGSLPERAGYLMDAADAPTLLLLDTEGKTSEKPFEKSGKAGGALNVLFAMPEEGFYNAYAERRQVAGDVLEVQIAKAEVMKHSCREGHDDVQAKMPYRHLADAPLEIVRERLPKENFHTLLGHGDRVNFLVLRKGVPLAGVRVTLTSGKGWSKTLVSDEQGRVGFTMIRDYYPSWERFQKRHAQPYLVSADYTLPEAGELNGQSYTGTRYLATFAGSYHPSPADYESYAYGLSFGLFALVSSAGGVYLFRRRRKRPYREVGFDE